MSKCAMTGSTDETNLIQKFSMFRVRHIPLKDMLDRLAFFKESQEPALTFLPLIGIDQMRAFLTY